MSENADVTAVAERTALAWQRTTIGVLAIGALLVRWSVVERFPLWPAIVLTTAAALASLVLVRRRYQRVRATVSAGQTPLSRYFVPGATVVMLLLVAGVGAAMLVEYSRL
ncbi:DUF202 domain-containing protein [Mycolicibacterium aichiense]|uniref:DUF202 domain-containing protein n=1 Tax=Mycolicibacterium aichiense TaxID=1799 RepID=A0AAD1HMZ6_9MYCO|nr:DUF202 domain-containing protein [Mycolicibacterium aichiense]MCV7020074.1 DUF202 domain-containing protein [Mycolicibacterium aichiense]BBX07670.1 hypothetical protein MAIC_24730 [Mycolicibacterium aichiense]STZ81483.1 Uncharacterised protein [Mycolicibacterium aichiense]